MKSQDIFILLKLISFEQAALEQGETNPGISVRGLEQHTGVGKSEVSAALNRCVDVGLAAARPRKRNLSVNRQALFEFIQYGLKYVFPVKPAELTRGVPTSFAAPVLNKALLSEGDTILVWPHAEAKHMGQALTPLYRTAPMAIKNDDRLYRFLALVDAIRVGNAREKNTALNTLRKALQLQ